MEDLERSLNDLHGHLTSAGAVKPRMVGATGPSRQGTAQTKAGGAPTQPGSEPLRTGRTESGAEASPTTAK